MLYYNGCAIAFYEFWWKKWSVNATSSLHYHFSALFGRYFFLLFVNWSISVMRNKRAELEMGRELWFSKIAEQIWSHLSKKAIFLNFIPDGGPKYTRNQQLQYHATNGIVNPALQTSLDHLSTLSRPRSAEAVQSNGSLANGRYTNGVVSRGSNGLHEDLDFPTTPRTLSRKKNIVWMRPHVSIFQLIAINKRSEKKSFYFILSLTITFDINECFILKMGLLW